MRRTIAPQPGTLWPLILADEPDTIAGLEKRAGISQRQLVSLFIERTCWGTAVSQELLGRRGSRAARLHALLHAYREGA